MTEQPMNTPSGAEQFLSLAPNLRALDLFSALTTMAECASASGWAINLAAEIGGDVESLTFSAAKPKAAVALPPGDA